MRQQTDVKQAGILQMQRLVTARFMKTHSQETRERPRQQQFRTSKEGK